MKDFEEYKGFIRCPFCKAKSMVKRDAHGQATHWCKCGKLVLYDYDRMTAEPADPIRGAAKHFADKQITMVAD